MFICSTVGPLIISIFLLINSLILWSDISPNNILDNAYASMDIFFVFSPFLFLIFIPAISMRTFSEEYRTGTIETLLTKPISEFQIVISKFLAILSLVIASIISFLLSIPEY